MTELAPSRRTLVRGAAWSVPVVAVAATAPAYAASPCGTTYTWKLDWGTTAYTKNSTTNVGTATVGNVSGTAPITVTFTSTVTSGITRHPTNLNLENGISDVGDLGAGEQGLELWHSSTTNSDSSYQTVRIGFSRQVTDLAFTITDIDYDYGKFSDRVALSGDRTGTPTTQYVVGSGTYSDPWRPRWTDPVTTNDTGDNRGNVSVRYNSPVDAIEIRYWNRGGSGQQAVWIADMTWKAIGC
jgi:hypothetical protein